jgi:hypothetical protein
VSRYRYVWVTVAGITVTFGVWAALVEFTIESATLILIIVALLSTCVLLLLHDETEPGYRRGRIAADAVVAALAFLALFGLVALVGPTAWLLLPLWGLSRPRTLRYVVLLHGRRSAGRSPRPTTASGDMVVEPSPLVVPALAPGEMGLEELCWAWRRSFVQLQRCRTVRETTQVVDERRRLLDELERRNPQGLSTWLNSGARAAGNPARYVVAPAAEDHDRAGGPLIRYGRGAGEHARGD